MKIRWIITNNKRYQTDTFRILGSVSRLTGGPFGPVLDGVPNPTSFRNP